MRGFCRLFLIPLSVASLALGAQPTTPARTLQVVWSAGGGDDPATSFAQISSIAVASNGDVVAWDQRTPALRLYNDAGKLLRTIGRKGAGPGEFDGISGLAYGGDGKLYVWDSGNGRLNVYKPNGDFEKQLRLPINSYSTSNGLTIDTQGRAWLRFTIFDRAGGKTEGAWIRVRIADGVTIDTVKQPRIEGTDPQLIARSQNGMSSNAIPYGRYPSFAITASGDLMIAPGGDYEIDVPYRGKVVKIQRAFTPIRIAAEERTQLKESNELSMRRTQPDWNWPSTGVPSVKPAFQSIAAGLDERIWVALYVESEKFTPDMPVAGQGRAGAPPPVTFRASGKKWDVFEPDGRYTGTVVGAKNFNLRVMRGNFAWGIAYDEDDVPTLVKLKIVPALKD